MDYLMNWWPPTSVDSITSKLAATLEQLDEYHEQCDYKANGLAQALAAVNKEADRAGRIADRLRDILT